MLYVWPPLSELLPELLLIAAIVTCLPEPEEVAFAGAREQFFTSLVPTSLWILARFSGLAKHKSRYLTKLYSITTTYNSLKYREI
jgi:hypothetical protein